MLWTDAGNNVRSKRCQAGRPWRLRRSLKAFFIVSILQERRAKDAQAITEPELCGSHVAQAIRQPVPDLVILAVLSQFANT